MPMIAPAAEWETLVQKMKAQMPEAFAFACDDPKTAKTLAEQLRGFKVGVNTIRSRGDREEPFGGIGQSWKGCFVGGKYLVQSVTQGTAREKLHGQFPDYTLLPEEGAGSLRQ